MVRLVSGVPALLWVPLGSTERLAQCRTRRSPNPLATWRICSDFFEVRGETRRSTYLLLGFVTYVAIFLSSVERPAGPPIYY